MLLNVQRETSGPLKVLGDSLRANPDSLFRFHSQAVANLKSGKHAILVVRNSLNIMLQFQQITLILNHYRTTRKLGTTFHWECANQANAFTRHQNLSTISKRMDSLYRRTAPTTKPSTNSDLTKNCNSYANLLE